MVQTRTHKLMHRPWPSQQDELLCAAAVVQGLPQSIELESLRDDVTQT